MSGLSLPYLLVAFFSLSLGIVLLLAQIKLFNIDKSLKQLVQISKRQEALLKRLEAKAGPSSDS